MILLKNRDSDISNATGNATIIESRKAIITRDSVANISTIKLSAIREIKDVNTLIGDGKNKGLIRLLYSVM